MKISVFLNADVSNTNADFYVMIENKRYLHFSSTDICISVRGISIQLHIAAF